MRNASKYALVATYGISYKLFRRTDKDGFYEISSKGILLPCWADNDTDAIKRFARWLAVPVDCICKA
jgi:hypothetical protein